MADGEDGRLIVEREGARAEGSKANLKRLSGPSPDPTALLFVPGTDDFDRSSKAILAALTSQGIEYGRYVGLEGLPELVAQAAARDLEEARRFRGRVE